MVDSMTSTLLLLGWLVLLILVSAFFSGSETGLMAINRYRLKHLVRKKHPMAQRVDRLLTRPDRILGVILIGNTFANILASALATVLAVRLFGELGVAVATVVLTLVVLVFAEVTPKTMAALHPRRIAFFVALPLQFLLKVFYPLVWLVNGIANGLLRLFGVKVGKHVVEPLSRGDLQAVLKELEILPNQRKMLLGILDLEDVTVNDIMVPRNKVLGIDINKPWSDIVNQLKAVQHTRLLVFQEDINQVRGFIHSRVLVDLFVHDSLNKNTLLQALEEPYFIPDGALLNVQLLNFQREKQRVGLVVDEYGDVQGLVTLADILEEIVGEFCTDEVDITQDVRARHDGSYLVGGHVPARDLNRLMGWHLPTDGPNTISGLIIESLEMMPEVGICLRLGGYPIEIVEVGENKVKKAKIFPVLRLEGSGDGGG